VYQHSWFWTKLRLSVAHEDDNAPRWSQKCSQVEGDTGREIIRRLLHEILQAAAVLHHQGIVHRDIKPSNVLCTTNIDMDHPHPLTSDDSASTHCVLGDFSSGYNDFVARTMYTGGPSRKEQTDEYAPPEAIFGYVYEESRDGLSPAFDSWSIGIVALELLLGTPSVFSVDQRTR
jgi:serine/threonine protein kinase